MLVALVFPLEGQAADYSDFVLQVVLVVPVAASVSSYPWVLVLVPFVP